MDFKKTIKVAIFIDYDNFTIGYKDYHGTEVDEKLWDGIVDELLNYYKTNFSKNDFEVIENAGTWVCVGMSEDPYREEKDEKKNIYRPLDRKNGFILNYGYRKPGRRDGANLFHKGAEKGVDSEIICQMLMGAFLNHYDSCILISDDSDYLPAVRRVQEYFGKKVIQAGFHSTSRLREKAYAHIPFEKEMNLKELTKRLG